MAYTGTTSDRLAAVRQAIDDCLNAHSYTVRGRQKITARLDHLMKLEERLEQAAQAESDGGRMASGGRYVRPT